MPHRHKVPDDQAWWDHWCPAQKDVMRFKKGTECDWCGETYKHPTETELKRSVPVNVLNKIYRREHGT